MIAVRSNSLPKKLQNRCEAFLVDDDRGVLSALTRLLQAAGYRVNAYSSAEKFLSEHEPLVPGFLILDISMPGLNGLNLQSILSMNGIERPIIFLTGQPTVDACAIAMKAGAVDFLIKPFKAAQLFDAIQRAEEQDRLNCECRSIFALFQTLTQREKEVLIHVIAGEQNKIIAASLGIAEKTIKVHRGRMMEKMRARSIAALVRMTEKISLQPHPP